MFLYEKYEEFDNAIDTMTKHSAIAWQEGRFKEMIVKVANTEYYYKVLAPIHLFEPNLILTK